MRRLVVVTVLGMMTSLVCLFAAAYEGDRVEAATSYKVSVWYPGWGTPGISDYESLSRNAPLIDQVNPYWYALKKDGSIASYEWAEDKRLLSLAREKRILVMPLISNEFDGDRVNRMLSSKARRNAHAAALVDLVVSKGYAGLDLDYEMLRASDRNRFSLFVETLASRLHAKGKRLGVAVHPKTSEPGSWSGPKAQDWKRIGRAADEFKIMTYDYHWDTSKPGPIAPPRWMSEVLGFAVTKVAPRKIRMGVPFYGYDWNGSGGKAEPVVHAGARKLIEKHGSSVQRSGSKEPYFTYTDSKKKHTVYYQDRRSVAAKLDVLVRKHPKVGGIAVWHIGGEDTRFWAPVKNKLKS